MVPNLISMLFMPRIASLAGRPNARAAEIYMQMILVYAVPIAILGCTLMPQILLVLFGAVYLPASPTMTLLLLNAMVVSLNIGLGTPLVAVGRQDAFVRVVAAGAGIGILLNAALIPAFAPQGAAAGTLLDESVVLAMLIRSRREVRCYGTARSPGVACLR